MNTKKSKVRLWSVLTALTAILTIAAIVGNMIANQYATTLNVALNASTYKIIKGNTTEDTEYFKAGFASDEEREAYEAELCATVEAEGAALLKNDNAALPLADSAKVSLFGHGSVDLMYGGTGSGSVDTSKAPNLKEALEAQGIQVNQTLWDLYKSDSMMKNYSRITPASISDTLEANTQYAVNEAPWSALSSAESSFAEYGDAAIVVFSRSGGEGADLPSSANGTNDSWISGSEGSGNYLELSAEEIELLKNLKALKDNGTFKSIVVLINSSNALEMDFLNPAICGEDYGIAVMRKSISVAFFSLVSTLMVLGIVLMGASEWVLFKNYFAKDRYETLDQVVGVTQRTAQYLVQQAELPEGDELDALSTKLEIIGESAEAYLFFTDNDGRVMIASSPDKLESLTVPEEMMEKIDASDADYYHVFGTLGGMLDGKSYITVSEMRNEHGQPSGYLFLCSSGEQLTQFKQQFWSNFLLSACVMLLCASILTKILMRQLTDPLQKVTDAAQRFGGGDLSVRVEGVEGEGEAADLARTFNRMADNIQMNDNSRGQFMGNIAHELRTPMTTIKGFVDGILDGTIPPDMQNHYLQLVSEETGRLARLIQNMLDLSKLESGEYQVNARMFNIWETITGVALSAEQRINDGMIDIDGLTMDEKVLVYADPDLIHQVVYNLLDNAIKFTPAGGTIRFGVEKLGPEAEISIWNSGQGISPEALPYVFQRFYKEDRSRGLHARGAGLGLNICKVLVNLSGGQIRVESQQGEWCRFVFTLPTVAPNPGGMKRLPDEAGGEPTVEDPASMKPVE